MLSWEKKAGFPLVQLVGVDEVGRGCLAGPVCAAAVLLPSLVCFKKDPWLKKIQDSKKCTPQSRQELSLLIESWAAFIGYAECSAEEIDEINIRQASLKAMALAVSQCSEFVKKPIFVLVDGKDVFSTESFLFPPKAVQPIIKGDSLSLAIAAASIVAKVRRDQLMTSYSQTLGYDFAQHKGYPTVLHYAHLKKKGPSFIHRKSFLR